MHIKSGVKAGAGFDRQETIDTTAEVASPRDAASGSATGKRMHKPYTVTVETAPATLSP